MANLKDTIVNGVLQVNGKINTSDKIIAPAFLGALTGNSTSSTKLQTARKINGVAFDGTKDIFIPSASDIPIGSIVEFGTLTNIPNGWLICDGRAVSRTTYDELFKIIGTTYGAGDGSTTFNLPDLRGRVLAGYKSDNTNFNTLGKKGGAETLKLTVDNLPSHNHSFTGTAHTHTLNNHTHSVPAHAHGLNSHTHTVAAHNHTFSGTTVSAGGHYHKAHFAGQVVDVRKGICSFAESSSLITGMGGTTHTDLGTTSDGAHTHTYSGTTSTKAQFNTGAASGNTANSAALTTGASNVNTSSVAGGGTVGATGAGAAISLLQPYFTTIFIIKAFIPAELPLNSSVQVIDNLTTTSATNALSANQGKILNDKKLDKTGGTMTGALNFDGGSTEARNLTWIGGTYLQRIAITDDANTGTKVFSFQQSQNSGTSFKELFAIQDDGKIKLCSTGGGYDDIQSSNHSGTLTHTLPIMAGRLTTSTDASVQNIRAMAEATFESQKDSLPDGSFVAIW